MSRIKRVMVTGDLTGFGRCALSVSMPVISALGAQACPLPTCIFSAHPWHDGYHKRDLSEDMRGYIEHWQSMGLGFDGALVGFLYTLEQIEMIEKYAESLRRESKLSVVLVDPVMGDYGKRYKIVSDGMLEGMRRLVAQADIITPNMTEACMLAGIAWEEGPFDEKVLEEVAAALHRLCKDDAAIVIKSVRLADSYCNLFSRGGNALKWRYEPVPQNYPGCGDLFASLMLGKFLDGGDDRAAFLYACETTNKIVRRTFDEKTPPGEGLLFEGMI